MQEGRGGTGEKTKSAMNAKKAFLLFLLVTDFELGGSAGHVGGLVGLNPLDHLGNTSLYDGIALNNKE